MDRASRLAAVDERIRAWSSEHPQLYVVLEFCFVALLYAGVRGLLSGDLVGSLVRAPVFAIPFVLFRILVYGWPLEGGLQWRRQSTERSADGQD